MIIRWNSFQRFSWFNLFTSSLAQKLKGSFKTFFGNFSPSTEKNELGLLDYFTLGIPRMLIGLSRFVFEQIQDDYRTMNRMFETGSPFLAILFFPIVLANLLYKLAAAALILAVTVIANSLKALASTALFLLSTPFAFAAHLVSSISNFFASWSYESLKLKVLPNYLAGSNEATILKQLNDQRDARYLTHFKEKHNHVSWQGLLNTPEQNLGQYMGKVNTTEKEYMVIEPMLYLAPDSMRDYRALGLFKLSDEHIEDDHGELKGIIEVNAQNKSGIQSLLWGKTYEQHSYLRTSKESEFAGIQRHLNYV